MAIKTVGNLLVKTTTVHYRTRHSLSSLSCFPIHQEKNFNTKMAKCSVYVYASSMCVQTTCVCMLAMQIIVCVFLISYYTVRSGFQVLLRQFSKDGHRTWMVMQSYKLV